MSSKITRADVARAAGVSESTVSRALNDSPRISEAVRRKVAEAARLLGYVPNRQAVLLTSKRTMRIGLVVRTRKNLTPFARAYFPALLDGVLRAAEEFGYSVTVLPDTVGGKPKDLSLPIKSRELDGFIFSVTALDDPRFLPLKEQQVPFVLVNTILPAMWCVACDPEPGIRAALLHAAALGHSRIAYITGDLAYHDGTERLKTFTRLADELGFSYTIASGTFTRSSGYQGAEQLLGSGAPLPTLIMCASDREALGVMDYCRASGISIPEELSLIGFDDIGPAQDHHPALTTISQPVSQMGGAAFRLLQELLQTGDQSPAERVIRIDTQLVVRDSTAQAAWRPDP
jgi:LacI family transcriptional regulator